MIVVFQKIGFDWFGSALFFEEGGYFDFEIGGDCKETGFEGFVVEGVDGDSVLGIWANFDKNSKVKESQSSN